MRAAPSARLKLTSRRTRPKFAFSTSVYFRISSILRSTSEPPLSDAPLISTACEGTRDRQEVVDFPAETCAGRLRGAAAVISSQSADLFCPPSCRQSQPPEKRDNYTGNEVCRKIKARSDPGAAQEPNVPAAL